MCSLNKSLEKKIALNSSFIVTPMIDTSRDMTKFRDDQRNFSEA